MTQREDLDRYFDRAVRVRDWPLEPVPEEVRYTEPVERERLSGWLVSRAFEERDASRMLDIGVLTGRLLARLDPSIRTDGIDISPASIEHLQAVREGTYRHASVTAIPFSGSTYDWVNCVSVLEYLEPEEAPIALDEIARVLKPGGILTASFPDASSEGAARYARMEAYLGIAFERFTEEQILDLVGSRFGLLDLERFGMSYAVVARRD